MRLRQGLLRVPLLTSRATRWLVALGLAAMVVIGLGLLVLLTRATGNVQSYHQSYEWLLLVNAVVAAALFISIVWGMVRLLVRLRRAL